MWSRWRSRYTPTMPSTFSQAVIRVPGKSGRPPLLPVLLASMLVLTACTPVSIPADSTAAAASTTSGASTPTTALPAEAVGAAAQSEATEPADEIEIKYGNFTEDQLSRAIIAEVAGQRGQTDLALAEYTALARESNNPGIIQRALRIAAFSRQSNIAIEMAELWLIQQPQAVEPRQMLALELVGQSRYREAFDQFEILLEQGQPVDFRLLSARIAAAINSQPTTPALGGLIEDYHSLLVKHPQHETLRLSLAHLYQLMKQPEPALVLIRQMQKEVTQRENAAGNNLSAGTDVINGGDLIVLEVQLLDMQQEAQQSLRRLQQGVRSHPFHKDLRYMYGRRLVADRKFEEARAQFAFLVDQNPTDYDLLYSLALLSMEVNLYAEARNYLQRLLLNGQRLDDAHYYLGFIDGQENRPEQAIEHYLQVKGGSNLLQSLRNLTQLMVRAGRFDEAHAHLQNLRFRNADLNIPLLSMEANILIDERRFTEATTLLNSSVGAFPNNVELLFLRSVLSQETNDLALMETDLRKIIQLEPDSPVAYNSLGYILADRTNRYQEAYELIQKAHQLSPDDPAIIDSLGWIQYKLGMYEDARANLDRAYELYPDAEVAAHLGEVLWMMGQKAAATRVWRNALQSQPDSVHVRNTMQRLDPSASI